MAITLTITDPSITQTYEVWATPLISSPDHIGQIVETVDGNVSDYYKARKHKITLSLGYMTAGEYSVLKGFIDRQWENRRYPTITITGAANLQITDMVARMELNSQNVIDNCGTVEGVQVSFRESKQL
jgi:hypothetical protein